MAIYGRWDATSQLFFTSKLAFDTFLFTEQYSPQIFVQTVLYLARLLDSPVLFAGGAMTAQRFIPSLNGHNGGILMKDNEFRRLYKDHQTLEARLEELDRKPHLTQEEEIERKNIQKMKLNRKDRMAEILRSHSAR